VTVQKQAYRNSVAKIAETNPNTRMRIVWFKIRKATVSSPRFPFSRKTMGAVRPSHCGQNVTTVGVLRLTVGPALRAPLADCRPSSADKRSFLTMLLADLRCILVRTR
jgi:hypothetical protein